MKTYKIAYTAIIMAGIALASQPVFAGLPSFNGASLAGIAIMVIGAVMLHRENTIEYSPDI